MFNVIIENLIKGDEKTILNIGYYNNRILHKMVCMYQEPIPNIISSLNICDTAILLRKTKEIDRYFYLMIHLVNLCKKELMKSLIDPKKKLGFRYEYNEIILPTSNKIIYL